MDDTVIYGPRVFHHCLPCNTLITSHRKVNQMVEEGEKNKSQQSIIVCVFELATVVDKSLQTVGL